MTIYLKSSIKKIRATGEAFLCFLIIFALLDPDQETPMNPDAILILIRDTTCPPANTNLPWCSDSAPEEFWGRRLELIADW
jgi:hypothetical protein